MLIFVNIFVFYVPNSNRTCSLWLNSLVLPQRAVEWIKKYLFLNKTVVSNLSWSNLVRFFRETTTDKKLGRRWQRADLLSNKYSVAILTSYKIAVSTFLKFQSSSVSEKDISWKDKYIFALTLLSFGNLKLRLPFFCQNFITCGSVFPVFILVCFFFASQNFNFGTFLFLWMVTVDSTRKTGWYIVQRI